MWILSATGCNEPSRLAPIDSAEDLSAASVDGGGDPALSDLGPGCALRGSDGGLGSFDDTTTLPLAGHAAGLTLADLDDDGRLDLVVIYHSGPANMGTFRNQGRRSFTPLEMISDTIPSPFPHQVVAGDVDGDRLDDVVVGNITGDSVSVFHNRGAGRLGSPDHYPMTGAVWAVALGDLDGDSLLDVVVSDQTTLRTLVHRDPLTLVRGQGLFSGYLHGLAVADFDGDGRPDVAGCNFSGDQLLTFRNVGAGRLEAGPHLDQSGPWRVAAGDLDGDGRADLAVMNLRGASVYHGRAGFAFSDPLDLPGFMPVYDPSLVALGDLDGDGAIDLLVGNGSTMLGRASQGGGTAFGPPLQLPGPSFDRGYGGNGVALADLDGDGDSDIAELADNGGSVRLLWNRCR